MKRILSFDASTHQESQHLLHTVAMQSLTLRIELELDLVFGNGFGLVGVGLALGIRVLPIGTHSVLTPVVMAKVEAIGNANRLLVDLHGADVEKELDGAIKSTSSE